MIELRCNDEKSDFGCCDEKKYHGQGWSTGDRLGTSPCSPVTDKDTTELDTEREYNTNVLALESDSNKDELALDKDKELGFVDFVLCEVFDFFQGAKKVHVVAQCDLRPRR